MLISKFDNTDVKAEIEQVEAQYHAAFPAEYRAFMLRYNGGYTPKTRFKIKKIGSDIRGFYGFGEVGLPVSQDWPENWQEKGLFPIALDSFGNYILIGLFGECYGQIFFCDHERGHKAVKLADSFAAFVKACKSEIIPAAARRSIEERRADLTARGREHVITPALIGMWQAELDKYSGMVQEEVEIE